MFSMNDILDIIKTDDVIQRMMKNTKSPKTHESFVHNWVQSELHDRLTQSRTIKLGTVMERIIRGKILRDSSMHLEDLKQKHYLRTALKPRGKGRREFDHLFADTSSGNIFFGELKCNLQLDSEKMSAVGTKMVSNTLELHDCYPHMKVQSYLVSLRFLSKDEIPSTRHKILTEKCQERDDIAIIGLNDYLKVFGVEPLSEEQYRRIVDTVCRTVLLHEDNII